MQYLNTKGGTIILTDEEIARWCNFPYKDSKFLAMSRVVDDILKAQLKKAMGEIQSKFRRTVIPSGSTRYSQDVKDFLGREQSAYFKIAKEDWLALLKETT